MKLEIPYVEKIVPDAYHGTTAVSAHQILKSGKFKVSNRSDDWLGSGVYFFESSLRFAQRQGKKIASGNSIGVICATINLGRCLNLNDLNHAEAVKATKKELLKNGVKEVTDALAINAVAHISKAEVVRGSFVWDGFGRISRRLPLAHPIFICVRVQKNILSMNLYYEGEYNEKQMV
ncbi:MAG: hypothetical protein PF441_03275 [Desulfuromusa sp.]|nr:hypothetical protein [Desulfuromusa sp.]